MKYTYKYTYVCMCTYGHITNIPLIFNKTNNWDPGHCKCIVGVLCFELSTFQHHQKRKPRVAWSLCQCSSNWSRHSGVADKSENWVPAAARGASVQTSKWHAQSLGTFAIQLPRKGNIHLLELGVTGNEPHMKLSTLGHSFVKI